MTSLLQIVFWACVVAFAYTHVVYPLLMSVFARKIPQASDPQHWPSVCVVIAAHNEEAWIERKISNALALDYPSDRLSVIVASDGSIDQTVPIASRFSPPDVKVLNYPTRRGKASVLNDAISHCTADVICISDANVMLRHDSLRVLVARLCESSRNGAVSADVQLESQNTSFGAGESLYYVVERALQLGESRTGSMIGVDGGAYVLWRADFTPLPADTILDDFLVSIGILNKGKRIVLDPAAIATESATPSAASEFRRRARVATGAMRTLLNRQWPSLARPIVFVQYLSHKPLRWFCPLFLFLILITSGLLAPCHPAWMVIFLVQLAALGLAALSAIFPQLRRQRFLGILFYFVITYLGLGWGGLRSLFSRPVGTWQRTERIAPQSRQEPESAVFTP